MIHIKVDHHSLRNITAHSVILSCMEEVGLVKPVDHDSGNKKAAMYNRMYSKVSGVDNTECDRDNTRINQIQEVLELLVVIMTPT